MFQLLKDLNQGCENDVTNIDNPDFIANDLTDTYDDIINGKISSEEIDVAVKKHKNSKAAGCHLIVK